jgi:spermidine synthase
MNGSIQSCEIDEVEYHTALVDDVIDGSIVCIFGGGEGATACRVLRKHHVTHVDMIEWDCDVVRVFQEKFPQWARGVWSDSRLSVYYQDAFEHITKMTDGLYSTVIIDLFEPSEKSDSEWTSFLKDVWRILASGGQVAMYAGMYCPFTKGGVQSSMMGFVEDAGFTRVYMKRTFIPSFLGEACFIYGKKHLKEHSIR